MGVKNGSFNTCHDVSGKENANLFGVYSLLAKHEWRKERTEWRQKSRQREKRARTILGEKTI